MLLPHTYTMQWITFKYSLVGLICKSNVVLIHKFSELIEQAVMTLVFELVKSTSTQYPDSFFFSCFLQQLDWRHRSMFRLLMLMESWWSVTQEGGSHSPKWSGETVGGKHFHHHRNRIHRMKPDFST